MAPGGGLFLDTQVLRGQHFLDVGLVAFDVGFQHADRDVVVKGGDGVFVGEQLFRVVQDFGACTEIKRGGRFLELGVVFGLVEAGLVHFKPLLEDFQEGVGIVIVADPRVARHLVVFLAHVAEHDFPFLVRLPRRIRPSRGH